MKSWLALSALLFSTALLASESESVKNSTLNSTLNTTQPSVLQSLAERVEINTVIDALSYPKAITTVVDKEKSTTHIIITTRDGELIVVNDERKVSRFTLPLDILYTKGQGGVLDILIPFTYPQDKTVLLSYSKGSDEANHLAVVKAQFSLTAGISDVQPVLDIAQSKDTPVHYGGKLLQIDHVTKGENAKEHAFLVTTGDGFDYREQAQVVTSQLGKVLGFTINGKPLAAPAFPEAPYVFTLGHRNPQGLVHGADGQIFLHEHGPDGGDELNLLQKGNNYGWPVVTLGKDYSGARISPFSEYAGMAGPLVDWTPSIAPSSMLYYINSKQPHFSNTLLVTSLKAKALFAVSHDKNGYTSTKVFDALNERLRDIAVDSDGNILLLTDGESAKVFKLSFKESYTAKN